MGAFERSHTGAHRRGLNAGEIALNLPPQPRSTKIANPPSKRMGGADMLSKLALLGHHLKRGNLHECLALVILDNFKATRGLQRDHRGVMDR